MRGFYEGSVDQIEGKNAWKIKNCRKKFGSFKNKSYLCSRFTTSPLEDGQTAARICLFSSVGQSICNLGVVGSNPTRGSPARVGLKTKGWFPEWPNGADCKSAASRFGGSNPSPPTHLIKAALGRTRK